jgi:hypothetical protein
MPTSGMLRRVTLVRTDVSEERSASITRVTRIGDLGTTLALTNNRRTLRRNTMSKIFINYFESYDISGPHANDTKSTLLIM